MIRWPRMLVAATLGLVLLLSGCSVIAQVAVDARPDGTGSVTVAVTLDKAAVASIGHVASELQTSDLAAAGWTVSGPSSGSGGTTVVTATKPFATLAQASSIVEEIAGSGTAGSRPFQVAVRRHRTFWKTTTVMTGSVDLRCGLACFGDPGLQKVLGSATGIDPATAQHDTGINPTAIFHVEMAVSLPGKLKSTNAPTRAGTETQPQLRWTPALGAEVPLLAMTETTDTTHVKEAVIAAAIAAVVLIGLIGWLLVTLWRRRGRRRGAHALHR